MKINIKKLTEKAQIPLYESRGAAAFDLVATSKNNVETKEYGYIEYGTDVGKIYPRSSIRDTGMFLRNGVGIIDSDYRGEVTVSFAIIRGMGDYKIGERVAQMIIEPIEQVQFNEVKELTDSERGNKGHGSTGK